ncbi:MAG: hypothetical protein A3C50_02325 [Candidatus Staskawiczbacteria bacterium RIFCSPHIGHO2_02_FULL_43_16]|uniref:Plasmid stabilization protein n=1 Tax=Candidatus Staskawiczbacteria bacterium RIFCSPHIGHO2_01_FULL_41_41 TaxID=1802203 RepID=A0A1G2HWV3_9BACT|nr:MAG: hypothetical protein A2822_00695 [Candidatus Staskawiczbacteria bacterium RIFCSPHIGHO2_01_FULL_41_41]OGZ68514.1 MAG: hypothetical protein A3C50_02325 [Candidatus Staskawiczbacteria bacterium RIFCSPHIGHO2_02_FULL_43_16]OGZ74318.1 MAG: hypothetical protein A3A12_02760 [Candidatus Staskawiczbacteria bacterium RIFCSPLOWO2_01_FULL_43_17b]
MPWNVKVADRVLKDVKKFPKKDVQRLLFVIEEMEKNPYQGDVQKLKGEENVWRCRTGSYRILYEIFPVKNMVWVFDVKRRTSSTY